MQRCYPGLLLGFSMAISQPIKISTNSSETYISSQKLSSQIMIAEDPETTEQNSSGGLFQQLNLTPQQKWQIKQIRRRYQSQIVQLKQNLFVAQQQLASMMVGTDSTEIIRAKHQEIAGFRQKLGELHFESMLATREVLTPVQRQKFAEIVEARY